MAESNPLISRLPQFVETLVLFDAGPIGNNLASLTDRDISYWCWVMVGFFNKLSRGRAKGLQEATMENLKLRRVHLDVAFAPRLLSPEVALLPSATINTNALTHLLDVIFNAMRKATS
jgi:hypothetical protein